MVLSEPEAERRLAALRRQREAIDRAITDLTLYLELGRRLTVQDPVPREPERPRSEAASGVSDRGSVDVPHAPVAGSPVIASETEPAATRSEASADSDGEGIQARRYGRRLIEAALSVLEDAGRPLHAGEILAALEARGLSIPGQQDPVAALNTRLWKRSGPGGPVRRLGDAVYALPDHAGR